jgi:T-complex protein 1 subunit theta
MGLHPSDIVSGYSEGLKAVEKVLRASSTYEVSNPKDTEKLIPAIKSTLNPKLNNFVDSFAKLIVDACSSILPENPRDFDADHVRIGKILGGSVCDSFVVKGMVVARNAEGSIKRAEKPKIAVFSIPFDT